MSYDNFAHTFSNSRKNLKWPELDSIIEDMHQNNYGSVLDIGCGNGRFIEEARNAGFEVIKYLGIDNSQGMIEEARKLHGEYQFEVREMSEIENIGTFDAIIFLASFHHLETIEERLSVLSKTKPLLNPKGRIYMTNWNLLEQAKYQKDRQGNGDFAIKIGEYSRYYHGFTLEELSDLFHKTGWNIVKNEIFEGGRNILSILQ